MFKRLLLILVVGVVLLPACAKPPVVELEDTRKVVAYAYASGASRLAPEEYRLASDALHNAERQIQKGAYQEAELALAAARNYANKSIRLAAQLKQQNLLKQEKLAEQKRQAEKRAQAELLSKKRKVLVKKVADKKKEVTPVAVKAPPEPKLKLVDQVEVAPGENLAIIAAQPEVYRDAMLWPLIYKANRDQIKDPKHIFPGQTFLIPRDKSQEEIEAARQEAEGLDLF